MGVSHNLIATGNSGEPRESTKIPILQRRSLKNGPEVKQCVRGSAGCISERAAARAQLTGSLCPLPGHHAASEASPFCTLCLQEHPPSSRPGRAFSARRLCRGASRPLHSTPRREPQSSRSGRPGRGGLSGPSGQGCFRSRVSTSPLLPERPPHRSPQAGAVATTLGSELPLPLKDRDGLGRVVALSVPGREVKDSLLDCN